MKIKILKSLARKVDDLIGRYNQYPEDLEKMSWELLLKEAVENVLRIIIWTEPNPTPEMVI